MPQVCVRVSKAEKTFEKVMSGRSDANISFEDVCNLLLRLGFALRRQGTSHHIYSLGDSYLNLQPGSGGKAKKYQVRQVREELKRINLRP
jgi:predicted RNA binding protein YcfA (HicA-like mRNA interferase family)